MFVVGQAIGPTMGTTSADRIKLYNGDAAMLAARLEAMHDASQILWPPSLPRQRSRLIHESSRRNVRPPGERTSLLRTQFPKLRGIDAAGR